MVAGVLDVVVAGVLDVVVAGVVVVEESTRAGDDGSAVTASELADSVVTVVVTVDDGLEQPAATAAVTPTTAMASKNTGRAIRSRNIPGASDEAT